LPSKAHKASVSRCDSLRTPDADLVRGKRLKNLKREVARAKRRRKYNETEEGPQNAALISFVPLYKPDQTATAFRASDLRGPS
jgi:hypothetical protein